MSVSYLRLEGTITALITPFKDGEIDTDALVSHLEWQIRLGVSGVVACGTTGEAATLSRAERGLVIFRCVDVANNKIPVLVSTGTNSTEATIELTAEAKSLGADAALIVTPYYNKPSQEGLYRHYEAITRAVDLPVIVYNVPSRTGVDLAPRTLERLSQLPNIVGIKDATGDIGRHLSTTPDVKARLFLLSGHDTTALAFNLCGGNGTISVAANVVPRLMVSMHRAIACRDVQEAIAIQQRLQPLISALERETNSGPVRYALHFLRGTSPEVRLPLSAITPETAAEIRGALEPLMEDRDTNATAFRIVA
ncbi:4-hydroxy-tetrahydrodipicolinate synthase [Ensifer sp. MJa1]|uniref:4-hydroxy-tetrahydrodipicolinate synthase n=1 Tax=Ensifer sp. MJa1 TaxID=2919888 RepID=UPI00300A8EE8